MNFTYNENLVFGNNPKTVTALKQISETTVLHTMGELLQAEASLDKLKAEFNTQWRELYCQAITGENIKCYFVIVLNGLRKTWEKLTTQFPLMFSDCNISFSEEILEYLDELLDRIDFDEMFRGELRCLNKE